jgi:hypothetical protein
MLPRLARSAVRAAVGSSTSKRWIQGELEDAVRGDVAREFPLPDPVRRHPATPTQEDEAVGAMAHRTILTDHQRAALFARPEDEATHLRFYVLSDHDIGLIRRRRRPWNRLGFALQLCALRYPGRLLQPGETIPEAMLAFVGAQLGFAAEELASYGGRRETRYEHSAALQELYGYRPFEGQARREMLLWLASAAEAATDNGRIHGIGGAPNELWMDFPSRSQPCPGPTPLRVGPFRVRPRGPGPPPCSSVIRRLPARREPTVPSHAFPARRHTVCGVPSKGLGRAGLPLSGAVCRRLSTLA